MENPLPLKAPYTMQRLRRLLRPASILVALLLVAAVGAYAWFFVFHPCELNVVEEASVLLFSQLNRYEDVYQVAISASPRSVVLPVSVLQQILMDTQQVAVPSCMQSAKGELLNYMRTIIRAFDAYAAQEPDATVRGLVDAAVTHLHNFDTELEAVQECAPYCLP
jgi:predicted PurR-regulated permease PerM